MIEIGNVIRMERDCESGISIYTAFVKCWQCPKGEISEYYTSMEELRNSRSEDCYAEEVIKWFGTRDPNFADWLAAQDPDCPTYLVQLAESFRTPEAEEFDTGGDCGSLY